MTQQDTGIGERVKFWEEQDKINQELIPRVIRQHELLTAHVADHENLPLIAGNAISEALAEAREEQRHQYETALEAVKADREEQNRQYQSALAEQSRQHETELEAAKTQLSEQSQTELNQALATLQQHTRQMRNLIVAVASGATAVSIAAIIVAILT